MSSSMSQSLGRFQPGPPPSGASRTSHSASATDTAAAATPSVTGGASSNSNKQSASASHASSYRLEHRGVTSGEVDRLQGELDACQSRAERAEDRLLRSMAYFSRVEALTSDISAHRAGRALIAGVESRNELGQAALWQEFETMSPVQFLKAELKTPTETVYLERSLGQFECGVPLLNGSLNMKLLPDLTINKVQREDLECQEGDRIISVDGMPVSSIEELRVSIMDKTEVTLVIENGGMPLFTIHDATTPYWEVTTVPDSTMTTVPATSQSKRTQLNPGDLVLRINDVAVSGLDTRKALDASHAKISLLPAASKLAQRIKAEGLMSFTTQVEVAPPKEGRKEGEDPRYNIILTNFEPAMFAGTYVVSVFLGQYQVGEDFSLEIVEGPADARRSDVVRDGLWLTPAGQPLEFKIVAQDGAGNQKQKGGDQIAVADATVTDCGNGTYDVTWARTTVGFHKIMITINGEVMQGTPEVDLVASDVHVISTELDLIDVVSGMSYGSSGSSNTNFTVGAGANASIVVKLYDKYGNVRPGGKDSVKLIQLNPFFHKAGVGVELPFQPKGQTYEFRGLVTHASMRGGDDMLEYSLIGVLVNGSQIREVPWSIDVQPGEVAIENCIATVTPAGITASAGQQFEFDVVVRDPWDNLRNHSKDTVELYEYNPATSSRGDRWGDYQVSATGHGSYRITARHTLARKTHFTFTVNGVSSPGQQHVYLLTIVPADVSISQCVVTGELSAVVGQYVALLIALRDEFGNVCSPQQTSASEISVANVRLINGDIDPKELQMITRISRVDFYPGIIYTHQVVLSTEQAVRVGIDLMLGGAKLQHAQVTFTPDELDKELSTVQDMPQKVVAGESFTIKCFLVDQFRNGMTGLEPVIRVEPDDKGDSGTIIKVSGKDQGKGVYTIAFKATKGSTSFHVSVKVGGAVIQRATMKVSAAVARAQKSEIEGAPECRVHFPFFLHVMLRDEWGNVCPQDASQLSVRLSGCSLKDTDAKISTDRAGGYTVTFLPRASGEVRFTVLVRGEVLADRAVTVRSLASWSKEDAAEWVQTLAHMEVQIKVLARALAQEFIRQNVTGAKIAGGLLDRGALHFAFGIEDMDAAERLAGIIADLIKGAQAPSFYIPWAWTTGGKPQKMVEVQSGEMAHTLVMERMKSSIPSAAIVSIYRVEDEALFTKFFEHRQGVGFSRASNSNERYLWYGSDQGKNYDGILQKGFVSSINTTPTERQVLGKGFYFAPDPRLADFFNGDGPASQDKKLILARVACGAVATKDALAQQGDLGGLREELEKPENSTPPVGSHSATSRSRTELVTFDDHAAYPEFVVSYRLPYPCEVTWPDPFGSSTLFKLEEVRQDL